MGDLNKDLKATRLKRRNTLLFNWDNAAPILNKGAKESDIAERCRCQLHRVTPSTEKSVGII